jgi:hypothetical protein
VRRVTVGSARLNVIVNAWWRVVVSIHFVSLLSEIILLGWEEEQAWNDRWDS